MESKACHAWSWNSRSCPSAGGPMPKARAHLHRRSYPRIAPAPNYQPHIERNIGEHGRRTCQQPRASNRVKQLDLLNWLAMVKPCLRLFPDQQTRDDLSSRNTSQTIASFAFRTRTAHFLPCSSHGWFRIHGATTESLRALRKLRDWQRKAGETWKDTGIPEIARLRDFWGALRKDLLSKSCGKAQARRKGKKVKTEELQLAEPAFHGSPQPK